MKSPSERVRQELVQVGMPANTLVRVRVEAGIRGESVSMWIRDAIEMRLCPKPRERRGRR